MSVMAAGTSALAAVTIRLSTGVRPLWAASGSAAPQRAARARKARQTMDGSQVSGITDRKVKSAQLRSLLQVPRWTRTGGDDAHAETTAAVRRSHHVHIPGRYARGPDHAGPAGPLAGCPVRADPERAGPVNACRLEGRPRGYRVRPRVRRRADRDRRRPAVQCA